ncbi:MAG: hypothetical protein ACRBBQ_16270 [Cognatishimia sp.]
MQNYIFRCAVVLSLCPFWVAAQESQPIKPETFVDTELRQGLISAPFWLRGLQFASNASKTRPVLFFMAPSDWANKTICANATTIDGRLLTTGQYQLPEVLGKEMTELAYPTEFPETWSGSTFDNSGLVLSEGACETQLSTDVSSRMVPVVFNGQHNLKRDAQNRRMLMLNIHARNTQELKLTLSVNDTSLVANCHKIVSNDAIQFNFKCKLGVPNNASGEANLVAIRLNKGRRAPPLKAVIIIPTSQ